MCEMLTRSRATFYSSLPLLVEWYCHSPLTLLLIGGRVLPTPTVIIKQNSPWHYDIWGSDVLLTIWMI